MIRPAATETNNMPVEESSKDFWTMIITWILLALSPLGFPIPAHILLATDICGGDFLGADCSVPFFKDYIEYMVDWLTISWIFGLFLIWYHLAIFIWWKAVFRHVKRGIGYLISRTEK